MFISGGENVYPAEIEDASSTSTRRDGCRGDRHPGRPVWGEVGRAFVVLKPGHAVTEDELARHCEAHLARYKVPKRFRIEEELPRTGTGKVQKNVLRAPAREVGADADNPLPESRTAVPHHP